MNKYIMPFFALCFCAVLCLHTMFANPAHAQQPPAYSWIRFLPADPQRGGYVKDLYPMGDFFAAVIEGNFAGRPVFKVASDGAIDPAVLKNEATAQSMAASKNRILLCNNIYYLNLTSTISLYSHDFSWHKEIATPFTDSEAVLVTPAKGDSYFVIAGQRMDGSFALWAVNEQGELLWQKDVLPAQKYTNNFAIAWHQNRMSLVVQHVSEGMSLLQFDAQGVLLDEIPLPHLPAHITFAKNTIPLLAHNDTFIIVAVTDDHELRVCFLNAQTKTSTFVDLPFTQGGPEYLRIGRLDEQHFGIGMGDLLYVASYAGKIVNRVTNPMPKAFIVCFTTLADGDVLVGGSYQTKSLWAPFPFVARLPKIIVFPSSRLTLP